MHRLPEAIRESVEAAKIPSPPEVLVQLMRTVEDENSTIGDLAQIVQQDPGLASRILAVANSPALRRGQELKSLESCLIAIGTKLIRALVTCLSIQSLFDRKSRLSAHEVADFWTHSLLVADIARELAEQSQSAAPDDAYLSGLLHDIGELILLQALGEPYHRFLVQCPASSVRMQQEQQLFGTTHADVGAWLIDHWHISPSLADGIAFHHAPAAQIGDATWLPQIVWAAQALTDTDGGPDQMTALLDAVHFPTTADTLLKTREQAMQRTVQIAEAMGMTVSSQFPQRHHADSTPAQQHAEEAPDSAAQQALSLRVEGMALLQPIQQDISNLQDMAEVALALKESAHILFELPRVAILLTNDAHTALTGEETEKQHTFFSTLTIPLERSQSLAALAATQRQVMHSLAPQSSSHLLDMQLMRTLGAEALLCIPLLRPQHTAGVMICGYSARIHAHLQNRTPWLLNFGKVAASTLAGIRSAQQQKKSIHEKISKQFNTHARQIIHEAGNPLGIIKSYLKILERKLPQEDLNAEIHVLSEEIDRISNIVGHMTNFSEISSTENSTHIGALLQDLLLLYADTLFTSRKIRIEKNLPVHDILLPIHKDNIKQIILNLLKNASEAMSAGGSIHINLNDGWMHQGRIYCLLQIEDTGPGIPESKIQALYTPLETSDKQSRGLGLSLVGQLARQEGIVITCQSKPGAGTSIALLLPKFIAESERK